MQARYDIVGLGCAAVDDLLYVDSYPDCDAKVAINRVERQCGGLTATALVAASRLGSKCAYAGVLGDDEHSRFVEHRLVNEGVDIDHVVRWSGAGPVRSIVVVGEDRGSRNIFFDVSAAIGHALACPVPDEVVGQARVLFIDHVDAQRMLRPATVARALGIPVVVDIEKCDGPYIDELLTISDHLILPQHIAADISGCGNPAEAAIKLQKDRSQTVIVTDGAKGCWAVDAFKAGRVTRHPAFEVQVIDSTGCGDVFHGAYASGLASGLNLNERIHIASAAAAIKAGCRGGQMGAPNRAALSQFLSSFAVNTI